MRQKAIAVAILAVFVVGIGCAFLYNRSQTAMAGMQGELAAELGNALHSEVTVGRVAITGLNQVTLYGVGITDGQGQPIATSDSIGVTFSLLSLLRGDWTAGAIKELNLAGLTCYLTQQPDGTWNVDQLLKETRSENAQFSGKVAIGHGQVFVGTPKGNWRLDEIDGYLDFIHKPAVAMDISGRYNGSELKVKGNAFGAGPTDVQISGERLPLDGWVALLPEGTTVVPHSGMIQDFFLSFRKVGGKQVLAGEAKLADASVSVAGIRLDELAGPIAFSDESLYLFDVKAKLREQALALRGKINIAGPEPVLDLMVASDNFDPAALGKDLPVSGPVKFTAQASGPLGKLSVSGDLSLVSGKFYDYPVTDVAARFALANGQQLTIQKFEAGMFGGKLAADGQIDLTNRDCRLTVNGRGVNMAALPGLPTSLSGSGDINLTLTGPAQPSAINVSGTAVITGGELSGVKFARLSGGFYRTPDTISLDYLTLDFAPGTLTAKGQVVGDRLNLSFFGQGVPLAALPGREAGLVMEGAADADGQVTGTVSDPVLTARFTARNGQALYQPFDTASGTVTLTRAAVTLGDMVAVSGAGRHEIHGTIGLSGDREMNVSVMTRKARAENLIKLLLPGEQLTGNVDNEMIVTGPLANFAVEGKVKLYEGSFRGHLYTKAEGNYRRANGVTELKDFRVSALNAEVGFDGTIDRKNQLNLTVTAKDIDVAALRFNYPYPVAGRASLQGKLTGTPSDPLFQCEISASGLVLNNQQIENIAGRLEVSGNQMDIPQFGFQQGNGRFDFSGGIDMASGAVYGNLSAANGSVASLLKVLNVPAKDIDGRLAGQVVLGGTVTKPNVWLTGTLSGGKIRNYPLESIDVDVALENDVITINRFYAKQGGGVLAVRGTAALNGPLDLEVGGRGLDAGLLTAWLDTNIDTTGKLSFAAQISGTAKSPHANLSLDISGGGVANATFDALYGLFILDNGKIEVNQLMLTKGPYRASAYGIIPLAALSREGRSQAKPEDEMDLKVKLEEANLSILPLLTKEVTWAVGETKGEVNITGDLRQPRMNGSIVVSNGTVKLASLADPIQKVGVDIRFEGDKINIISVEGSMGSGSYKLSGTAAWRGLALGDYAFTLALNQLGVNHKYFKGPLNGTLAIASGKDRPLLSGKLIFANTTVNIPFIPEFAAGGLDMALDLEIEAQSKVRLYNPYLYDLLVEGKANFGGTLLAPTASGKFSVLRGTVQYLRTPFKVTAGNAAFTQYASLIPVIKLDAEARLVQSKVNLAVNGPLDAMNIRLSSEPAMTQQEILALLTLRSRYSDQKVVAGGYRDSGLGRDELMGLLNTGLQMRFVSEAEGAFREAFGLDDFRLIRSTATVTDSKTGKVISYGDREVYNVELSKYLSDKLYVSYNMGLDHREHLFSFRYDISERFSLSGYTGDQNRQRISLETRFRF